MSHRDPVANICFPLPLLWVLDLTVKSIKLRTKIVTRSSRHQFNQLNSPPDVAEIFLAVAKVASSFSGFLPAKCSLSWKPPKFSSVSWLSSDMEERRERRPATLFVSRGVDGVDASMYKWTRLTWVSTGNGICECYWAFYIWLYLWARNTFVKKQHFGKEFLNKHYYISRHY